MKNVLIQRSVKSDKCGDWIEKITNPKKSCCCCCCRGSNSRNEPPVCVCVCRMREGWKMISVASSDSSIMRWPDTDRRPRNASPAIVRDQLTPVRLSFSTHIHTVYLYSLLHFIPRPPLYSPFTSSPVSPSAKAGPTPPVSTPPPVTPDAIFSRSQSSASPSPIL